jgi:hypothetical protein
MKGAGPISAPASGSNVGLEMFFRRDVSHEVETHVI